MSDPVSNDYTSLLTLTERQNRIAVFETVLRCDRMGISHSETREYLDILGLTETAWEVVGRPKPARQVSVIPRDAYGRLRTDQVPKRAESDPIPPGQNGHGGKCASGDHPWVAENIRTVAATGRHKCGPCEQRRQRGGSSRKSSDAVILCRCPGRKHVLTEETSESTYVTPDGKRQCKVGIERRRQAETIVGDVAEQERAS